MSQPQQALRLANETRLRQAAVRRLVKSGDMGVVEAIADPAVAKRRLGEVLQWQSRWGEERARKFLRRVQVSDTRACGALTDRERGCIEDGLAA